MIKYSIIIPCYNSERFIKVCINGLLKLSFDKDLFEVIFIDDCSTDSTVSLIKEYKQDTNINIRLFKNNINLGPGASRRYGAEMAKGDYIFFCDSDDWYDSELLVDVEKEREKEKSDLIFFDMSYILGSKVIRKFYTSSFEYGNRLSYLHNCNESLCNMAVKRSLFLSVPPIDIRNGEDLALVPLLITNAKRITHIDKSYYNYLMRSSSASLSKPSREAYNNMLIAFEHIRRHIKSDDSNILNCIELLGIKTILYNSTLMAIKGKNDNHTLAEIVKEFSNTYPFWYKNIDKLNFSKAKKLYLWSLKHKIWIACRVFAFLHTCILSRTK